MLLDRVLGQCFAALVDHVGGRRGRLCLKRCLILALLACLGGLVALGHASPLDPVWLPGIYDSADYDDAVAVLTDTAAVANSRLLASDPARLVVRRVPFTSASARAAASLLGFHLRSPPNA